MNDETEKTINDFREKMETLFDTFKAEDFRRIHAKFMGGLVALEVHFKRRFPEEWAVYEKEFYGEDSI